MHLLIRAALTYSLGRGVAFGEQTVLGTLVSNPRGEVVVRVLNAAFLPAGQLGCAGGPFTTFS